MTRETRAVVDGARTIVDGVSVFDGEHMHGHRQVVIDGSVVAAIADAGTYERRPGDEWIDGSGATLLPGLIDCHTHAYGTALAESMVFGVTASLDMFSDHHWAAAVKARQLEEIAAGQADLFSAGTALTAPGGHCTQYGLAIPTISDDTDIDAFVAARVAEGSDYIKVIVEGGAP